MRLRRLPLLGLCLSILMWIGCQTDSYSSSRSDKESLKDSIRTADSLNAIRMGDSIREIKVEVRELLRVSDSSQQEESK